MQMAKVLKVPGDPAVDQLSFDNQPGTTGRLSIRIIKTGEEVFPFAHHKKKIRTTTSHWQG